MSTRAAFVGIVRLYLCERFYAVYVCMIDSATHRYQDHRGHTRRLGLGLSQDLLCMCESYCFDYRKLAGGQDG